MTFDPAKVERLARETRDLATLASLVCNCATSEQGTRARDLLHALDDALESAHKLLREIVDGA
ncbi:hypothetical protein LCGC14_1576350 [marine sediment metagenome]|uniref:Uncharacterized protein n=1 Tax=marine sediment metagenome TaxID=412755 RepID=A0A0F9LIE0_9ZZZZ